MAGLLGGADDEPTVETDGGDDLFGDDGDDELLGDDDLMGGGLGFDDDAEASDEEELTYRLNEVEREVDSLVNKVETVRGENEKISESIESVERNVDKLVELYEIVTQGINPFVGDQEIGSAFESAVEDGFGAATPEDEVDEEISQASAEDFLDDEFDADVDDDDATFLDESALDAEVDDDDPLFEDEQADDDEPMLGDEAVDDESAFGDTDADALSATAGGAETAASSADTDGSSTAGDALAAAVNGEIGDPPYLVQVPSRTDAELATIDWLEFLVDATGVDGASESVAYYESIGWISEPVEAYLQSMLAGFDGGPADEGDPAARSALGADGHRRSLQYVAWIATPEREPIVFEERTEGESTAPT